MNNFKTAIVKQNAVKALNDYRHFLLGRAPNNAESNALLEKAISLHSVRFSELVILSLSEITNESCLFFLNQLFRMAEISSFEELNAEVLGDLISLAYFAK